METSEKGPVPSLFTVGHSNQPQDLFIDRIKKLGIQVLVDVRSYPYSKFVPHFDREELCQRVTNSGLRYLFMGKELGGRPDEERFYDEENRVLYYRLAESATFLSGIDRLEKGLQKFQVAIMCSEEDPSVCHRHLLVGRVLSERGIDVRHLRGDGSIQVNIDLPSNKHNVRSLFDLPEDNTWKSLRSVLRRRRQSNSSDSSGRMESSDLSMSD
jgi:uncharacterized protein (DUF488 family)